MLVVVLIFLVTAMTVLCHGPMVWALIAAGSFAIGFLFDKPTDSPWPGRASARVQTMLYWSVLAVWTSGFVVGMLISLLWPNHSDWFVTRIAFACAISTAAGICQHRGLIKRPRRFRQA